MKYQVFLVYIKRVILQLTESTMENHVKNLSLSRGLRLVSVAFFTVLLRLVSRNPLFPTSETRLRNIFSTLTETSLRDLFMFLLRPVSQMLFPSPTETGLGNLFFTLLRLVSVTLFLFYAETYLHNLFSICSETGLGKLFFYLYRD